jgi:hypothetical protein
MNQQQQSSKPIQQLVTEHLKKPKVRDPAQRLGSMNEGNALARAVRPYFPVSWQYGWKWNLIGYSFKGLIFMFITYSGKLMIYDPQTEEFQKALPKYEFVYDQEGKPVSVAPKRIAKQIRGVMERSQRFREESERSSGGW